jgi:putative membrane protein
MAMGIAEVIPGVSGGTIAFITGIYEKLLDTIKAFHPSLIGVFKKDGLGGLWEAVNGTFLLNLLIGMATGVVVGVFGVSHLLETYPEMLWAFFFGLIISSAIFIGKQVDGWKIPEIVALVFGIVSAYYITIASPAQGNEALWFVFLSGLIAISALILPGISGSFILLLMGMYTFVIPTVKKALKTFDPESLMIVGTFGLGCLVGLLTFSRVLSWTFKNYKNPTLALLTGFMLGSLNKLWPWRNVISTRINSKGKEVPFLEQSVLPSNYDGEPFLIGVCICMLIGFLSVFLIESLDKKLKD